MRKNSLSKDLDNLYKKAEEIQKKHKLYTDIDSLPTHFDKALDELLRARIDSIIDEVCDD